jgi:hypothetical protein
LPQSADAKLSTGDKGAPAFYQETVEAQAQKGHGSGKVPSSTGEQSQVFEAGTY